MADSGALLHIVLTQLVALHCIGVEESHTQDGDNAQRGDEAPQLAAADISEDIFFESAHSEKYVRKTAEKAPGERNYVQS